MGCDFVSGCHSSSLISLYDSSSHLFLYAIWNYSTFSLFSTFLKWVSESGMVFPLFNPLWITVKYCWGVVFWNLVSPAVSLLCSVSMFLFLASVNIFYGTCKLSQFRYTFEEYTVWHLLRTYFEPKFFSFIVNLSGPTLNFIICSNCPAWPCDDTNTHFFGG